jgi:hypothetical protein
MYTPNEADSKKIENNFVYHDPKGDQTARYEIIRSWAKEYAELLSTLCPASRELGLAITNLEQAMFWANSSIARNE